jgi:hypothetical protein
MDLSFHKRARRASSREVNTYDIRKILEGEEKVRKAIPITIGVILLLLGILFASQGAGIVGGSGLMDNNPAFIYVGG